MSCELWNALVLPLTGRKLDLKDVRKDGGPELGAMTCIALPGPMLNFEL